MANHYWLSFADNTGFLGVAIVEADDFSTAVYKAWDMDINPGGQVKGYALSEEEMSDIPDNMRHVLLNREQVIACGGVDNKARTH